MSKLSSRRARKLPQVFALELTRWLASMLSWEKDACCMSMRWCRDPRKLAAIMCFIHFAWWVVIQRETKSYGVKTIGLERKGCSEERLKVLGRAFRLLLS